MTCKTNRRSDSEECRRIVNLKLVSDTDGTLWQLTLDYHSHSAHLTPLSLTGPDRRLASLPARKFTFD